MVDIYSPSGKEEDILDFLKTYLKRHRIPFQTQMVDENRYNLLIMPDSVNTKLAFIGHVDTVAAYDLEDYGFHEQGDNIRGLGTADMKGGCAAMIEAYLSFQELNRGHFPAALCLVVGEEETGDGADQLTKHLHVPWAIIGEPTNLIPCTSSYGYLEIQVAARGKRMHACLANREENAIEAMLRVMLHISHYMNQKQPEAVYNIRDLYSLRTGFTVAEHCEAWLDIHVPPTAAIGEMITDLEEVTLNPKSTGNTKIDHLQDNIFFNGEEKKNNINISFKTETIASGYAIPEKGPMFDTLKSIFNTSNIAWKTAAFPSHSDANQLWAAGIKPIVLGPGQLEKAHTQDESVSFDQICQASQIYLDILIKLCI